MGLLTPDYRSHSLSLTPPIPFTADPFTKPSLHRRSLSLGHTSIADPFTPTIPLLALHWLCTLTLYLLACSYATPFPDPNIHESVIYCEQHRGKVRRGKDNVEDNPIAPPPPPPTATTPLHSTRTVLLRPALSEPIRTRLVFPSHCPPPLSLTVP